MLIELPDWERRLGILERMFDRFERARFDPADQPELDAEFPVIRAGLEVLRAEIPRLRSEMGQYAGSQSVLVSPEHHAAIARIEGRMRRTEARVFALEDSFTGH